MIARRAEHADSCHNPNMWKAKAGVPRIQGHLKLHSESECSLGYMSRCQEGRKGMAANSYDSRKDETRNTIRNTPRKPSD